VNGGHGPPNAAMSSGRRPSDPLLGWTALSSVGLKQIPSHKRYDVLGCRVAVIPLKRSMVSRANEGASLPCASQLDNAIACPSFSSSHSIANESNVRNGKPRPQIAAIMIPPEHDSNDSLVPGTHCTVESWNSEAVTSAGDGA
jgi:hypothetical protein